MRTTTWYGVVCQKIKSEKRYPRYFHHPACLEPVSLDSIQEHVFPSAVSLFAGTSKKAVKAAIEPYLITDEDTGQKNLFDEEEARK